MAFLTSTDPRGLRRLCRRLVFRRGRRQLRAAAVPGDGGHRPLLAGRALLFPAEAPRALPQRSTPRWRSGAPNSRRQGITQVERSTAKARERLLMQPWWLDWTAGLFPVILVVFLLRSFLFEPFKIPSGSMMPTLLVGDLILVNKFAYGLRLPVINTKITEGTPPQRGDVMVFRYPPKPSLDYIKRVVGVPGDEVAYLNKKLTINGQPVQQGADAGVSSTRTTMRYFKQYRKSWAASSTDCSTTTTAAPVIPRPRSCLSRIRKIAATVSRASCARCRRGTIS